MFQLTVETIRKKDCYMKDYLNFSGNAMFPIFEKSEVFCRSACPAIAFGDGGLSRHSLLQQQCNYWKNIISPQWEQSICNIAGKMLY